MGQEESHVTVDESVKPQTLKERSLASVADYIKSGSAKKIIVLTGAGISTSAGIPDFRSPGTGLYSNLARLKLPHAEAVFDISYFRQNPEPFYVLAKELYPGKFFPTISHAFIALLAKKGMLDMLFTQNIDCLERRAGVPAEKIVEAHGSFATQRCIDCSRAYPDEKMKKKVFAGEVPRCESEKCGGLVKPDIVFFGEGLPSSFGENAMRMVSAEVVLIIGTSLTVMPFARLPELTANPSPRVLFNMEKVGSLGSRPDDVLQLGACDDGICKLADELGWREELESLWKSIVGEDEVQRQRKNNKDKQQRAVEDEVAKLTKGVEDNLKIDEDDKLKEQAPQDQAASKKAAQKKLAEDSTVGGVRLGKPEEITPVAEEKQDEKVHEINSRDTEEEDVDQTATKLSA